MMDENPCSSFQRRFINLNKIVCRFYKQGSCNEGSNCLFPHNNDPRRISETVCRHYLKKNCFFGHSCYNDHVNFVKRSGEIGIELLRSQDELRRRSYERYVRALDCKLAQVPETTRNKSETESDETRGWTSVDSGTASLSYPKIDLKSSKYLKGNIGDWQTMSVDKSLQNPQSSSSSNCDSSSYENYALSYSDCTTYNTNSTVESLEWNATGRRNCSGSNGSAELRALDCQSFKVPERKNKRETRYLNIPLNRIYSDVDEIKCQNWVDPGTANASYPKNDLNSSKPLTFNIEDWETLPIDKSIQSSSLNDSSSYENYLLKYSDGTKYNSPKVESLEGYATGRRFWSESKGSAELSQEHTEKSTVSSNRNRTSDMTCSRFLGRSDGPSKGCGKMKDNLQQKQSTSSNFVSSTKISMFSDTPAPTEITTDGKKEKIKDKDSLNNLSLPSNSKCFSTDVTAEASKNCEGVATLPSSTSPNCERCRFIESLPAPVFDIVFGGVQEPYITFLRPRSATRRNRIVSEFSPSVDAEATPRTHNPELLIATGVAEELATRDMRQEVEFSVREQIPKLVKNTEICKTFLPNSSATPNRNRRDDTRKSEATNLQARSLPARGQELTFEKSIYGVRSNITLSKTLEILRQVFGDGKASDAN